ASRVVKASNHCLEDIARIDQIWSKYARENSNGDLRLLGEFGISDCMFAPVVMRFATYQPNLSDAARNYMKSMLASPPLKQWIDVALLETEVVDVDEAGIDR
ncbi:MAG: glutathione S-transferase, partial [Gammaproteobacteria bacterium]|nr:glutathione S-transferase [Gammaproteobacteria bacterium]